MKRSAVDAPRSRDLPDNLSRMGYGWVESKGLSWREATVSLIWVVMLNLFSSWRMHERMEVIGSTQRPGVEGGVETGVLVVAMEDCGWFGCLMQPLAP